jgi:hypothetical protein
MLTFRQKITPDPEVVAILVTCTEFSRLEDGRAHARLDARLESPLAERVEKVLAELGGQWDRHANCVVLPEGIDPERLVEQLLADGSVTVTARIGLTV